MAVHEILSSARSLLLAIIGRRAEATPYKSVPSRGRKGRPRLTEAQVRSIRGLKGQFNGPQVAAMYGISPSTVYNVWNGVYWQDVA